MVRLAYGHNVLERTVAIMTEVDPGWKLPDAFFPAQMEAVERGSKPCGMTMEGKIDANVGAEPQEVPALGGIEAAQGLSPTPFCTISISVPPSPCTQTGICEYQTGFEVMCLPQPEPCCSSSDQARLCMTCRMLSQTRSWRLQSPQQCSICQRNERSMGSHGANWLRDRSDRRNQRLAGHRVKQCVHSNRSSSSLSGIVDVEFEFKGRET